jgi:hypothetical protein
VKRPQFRRPQFRLVVCSFLIAAGVVLALVGVGRGITGKAAQHLPVAVESIDPVRAAVSVPKQTRVFVDLQQGFTGVLVIDGLELQTVDIDQLPATQVAGRQVVLPLTTVYEPGNATLTFVPAKGAPIESFTEGQHIVQVIYWRLTDGRTTARSYTWAFNVF